MMFPSHLLGTLLVGLTVSRVRPLSPREWALAIGFGVLIDLDHLVQLPAYVAAHGLAALEPGQMSAWGSSWQGFMHDPRTAAWVVGAATILARSWVPLAFWGLHMFQDFVIATRYVHFGGPLEWAIVAVLAAAVAALLVADRRARAPRATLVAHAATVLGIARRGAK